MAGRPIRDLTNMVFGRLRVLQQVGVDEKWGHVLWSVECECGTVKVVRGHDLLKQRKDGARNTSSCGCKKRERSAEHWPGKKVQAA
jgi:hypothetical protein